MPFIYVFQQGHCTLIHYNYLQEHLMSVSVPAAPARLEALLALRSVLCVSAFQRSRKRSLLERNGWNFAGTAEKKNEIKREEKNITAGEHRLRDWSSEYACCTHLYKTLTGRENAQTEGQQDPATEVAVTIAVVLKLLADLTVNLISAQTTDKKQFL